MSSAAALRTAASAARSRIEWPELWRAVGSRIAPFAGVAERLDVTITSRLFEAFDLHAVASRRSA